MTIEFLPLQHAEIEGRGQVTLSLRAVGVGSGLGAAGSAVLVTARDKSPATREINGGAPMLRPRE